MVYLQMYYSLFQCPTTADEWKKVSEGFQTTAKFPNCLGALDGKHIRIRLPPLTAEHSSSIINTLIRLL